jgi:hypothetical protein
MTISASRALLTAICACAPALGATALPIFSGPYSMNIETLCPASQTVDANGNSLKLTSTSPGEIAHTTGTLNFFASGTSGNFKTSSAVTDGSAILSTINGKATGTPFSLTDEQNFGTYRMGDSSLILTFDKQQPLTFQAVYGGVDSSNIAHRANLLIVSDATTPACATHILLSVQAAGR